MLEDWIELCKLLGAHAAEFLQVGGQAVIAHGYPRLTKDLDLWVRPTVENGKKARYQLRCPRGLLSLAATTLLSLLSFFVLSLFVRSAERTVSVTRRRREAAGERSSALADRSPIVDASSAGLRLPLR